MAWLAALPTVYAQGYYVGKPVYEFPVTHEVRSNSVRCRTFEADEKTTAVSKACGFFREVMHRFANKNCG